MARSSDRLPPLPSASLYDAAEAEQAIQDSPRLLEALNGARLAAWHWDMHADRISWSPGAEALFGLQPDGLERPPIDYLGQILPEDRDEVLQRLHLMLDGHPNPHPVHHRIRWPDGSLHWLEVSGRLHRDDHGNPHGTGVIREIGEQHARRQDQSRGEDKFSKAFHNTPDTVVITEKASGRFIEINASFERQFGWSKSEAVGRTSLALGLWLLWQAREVRTPWRLRLKMLGNLGVEAVIGLVPLFGDIFDIAWQANQRNRTLLLDWMDAEDRKAVAPPAGSLPWWPLALVALLLLAVFIWQLSP